MDFLPSCLISEPFSPCSTLPKISEIVICIFVNMIEWNACIKIAEVFKRKNSLNSWTWKKCMSNERGLQNKNIVYINITKTIIFSSIWSLPWSKSSNLVSNQVFQKKRQFVSHKQTLFWDTLTLKIIIFILWCTWKNPAHVCD